MIKQVDRKYLEIKSIESLINSISPNKTSKVTLINPPDFQLNKFLYKQIGKKHRWIDRLEWNDQKWIEYVNNENVDTYVLKDKENLIGYFELIKQLDKKECEIGYFGILPEFIGKKYGGFLLSEAIREVFKKNFKRVWLHTCSLDHKNALNNYISRGMKIFKSESVNIYI
tara:strand:+ start:672 stop:1181 length:510 start_codon:yes stop_codon:yes gene_type:complete